MPRRGKRTFIQLIVEPAKTYFWLLRAQLTVLGRGHLFVFLIPFGQFLSSPELMRKVVMMYVRLPLSLRAARFRTTDRD